MQVVQSRVRSGGDRRNMENWWLHTHSAAGRQATVHGAGTRAIGFTPPLWFVYERRLRQRLAAAVRKAKEAAREPATAPLYCRRHIRFTALRCRRMPALRRSHATAYATLLRWHGSFVTYICHAVLHAREGERRR